MLKSSELAELCEGVGGSSRNWYGCGAVVKYGYSIVKAGSWRRKLTETKR